MQLPPIPHFLVRWILRLALLVIFVGLPLSILYLRDVGVGFGLKDQIATALSGEKYHTVIGRLLFDPFKGLIAEDVVVRESGSGSTLAQIKRLVVSIALNDLLAKKVTVDFIELDDTDVFVPLGGDDPDSRLKLRGVTAQCIFLAGQLRLSYFDARLGGLNIALSGLLQNPQSFALKHGDSKGPPSNHPDAVSDWLRQLSKLRFLGAKPELRAEIAGDLTDLSTLRVSPISLRTGPIIGKKWRVESVAADASYVGGIFTLSQFMVRGTDGALSLTGRFHDGILGFELSNSLGPLPFLDLLPKESQWRSLKFDESPQIDAFGSITFSPGPISPNIIGRVRCGSFSYRGVQLDSLSGDFALKGSSLFARGVHLASHGGRLDADILYSPGDFRLRFTDTIPPTVFAPALGEKEQAFLKMMEFHENPLVQLELRGPSPNFADLSGQGKIHLGRTAMRHSWMDSGDADLLFANKAVTYKDFTIKMGKGVGTGTFVYDFGGQQVRFSNIVSTLDPIDVLMWVDPKIADAVRPYRFHQPPRVQAQGMVHLKDPHKNALYLKLLSAEGLDYDLLKKTLKFGRTIGDINIVGTKVNANIKSAQLMHGDIGLKAVVSIEASDPTFGADVDVRRVDFAPLTNLFFHYTDSTGTMSGTYNFTARIGEEEKMRGTGKILVQNGHVLSIPVLGPLSIILDKIIPGSGYETAREATADFTIGDEKIHTNNLTIEGFGFNLYGHGDIFFMTDKMDLSVRINAKGVPGIVLFPVSKLMEYVSTGSVWDPQWRPKIIPRFGGNPDKTPASDPRPANSPTPLPASAHGAR